MLIEFRVGNYKSFKDIKTLSLVAGSDDSLKNNCVEKGKLKLLKAASIYGPNASGKSNLIDALATMKQIIEKPLMPGKKLPIVPFRLDDECTKAPTFFEVTFHHEKVRYQYGFTATTERVYKEWLYAYPDGRQRDTAQTWFERKYDKKTKWSKPSSFLKGQIEKLKTNTAENVLLLTKGAQENNKQLTSIYRWFSKKIDVMQESNLYPLVTIEILREQENYKIMSKLVKKMICYADFGVYDVNVVEREIRDNKLNLPTNLSDEERELLLKQVRTNVEFVHKTRTGNEVIFAPSEESKGTIRFFELVGLWISAVVSGSILLIDEIEASLHPHLVSELVKLVQNIEINKFGAQLLFTTHDTTLLNSELFRRDQIWFTEKDESGSSNLYSLLDYKARKDEAMQKNYLAGRYGAVPIIEAFKLNG